MDFPVAQRFPMEGDGEWLAVGQKGWALWHHARSSSVAFIRFTRFLDSWWIEEVRFVRLPEAVRLQANDLRLLALGRVQSMASDPDIAVVFNDRDTTSGLPVLDPSEVTAAEAKASCEALPERSRVSSLQISVPPKGQRDVYFYEILDTTYRRAASQSSQPAKDIAEANGVPVSTVHSWLKAMRKAMAEQKQQQSDAALGLIVLQKLFDTLPEGEPIGNLVFEEETLEDGTVRVTMRNELPDRD